MPESSLLAVIDGFPPTVRRDVAGHPYDAVTYRDAPADGSELVEAWSEVALPPQVRDLWLSARRICILYRDSTDGLIIYDPTTSREETQRLEDEYRIDDDRYHSSDIVVGDFQGIDDLLVYSESDGWLVTNPMDTRDEWIRLGDTLERFLLAFKEADGVPDEWNDQFLGR